MSAIQLVSFNEKNSKFEMNPDSVKFLEQLKDQKLAIVSITGKYRTGKSFFANQVLIKMDEQQKGFDVKSGIRTCTKGLQIWDQLIENPYDPETKILVVDCEGFGDSSNDENNDSIFFLLTMLISSLFIYNTKGAINEHALNDLSFIIELTKLIKDSEQDNHFIWVLRDFTLQLLDTEGNKISENQYFENALRETNQVSNSSKKNHIRKLIKSFFKKRHCFTMVVPTEDEKNMMNLKDRDIRQEFKEQSLQIREFIFQNVQAKKLKNRHLNGPLMIEMIDFYISKFNNKEILGLDQAYSFLAQKFNQNFLKVNLEKFEQKLTNSCQIYVGSEEFENLLKNKNQYQSFQDFEKDINKCVFQFNKECETGPDYEKWYLSIQNSMMSFALQNFMVRRNRYENIQKKEEIIDNSLKLQIQQLENQVCKLNNENVELQRNISTNQQKNEDWLSQMKKFSQDNEQLKNEIIKQQYQSSEQCQKSSRLEQNFQQQIELFTKKQKEYEMQIVDQQDIMKEQQDIIREQQKKLKIEEQLRCEMAKKIESSEELLKQSMILDQSCIEIENQRQEIALQKSMAMSEIEDLKNMYQAEQSQKIQEYQMQLNELKSQLIILNEEHSCQKEQCNILKSRVEFLQMNEQQNDNNSKCIEDIIQQNQKFIKEKNQMISELMENNNKVEQEKNQEIQELYQQIEQMVEDKKNFINELMSEKKQLQEQIDSLQHELVDKNKQENDLIHVRDELLIRNDELFFLMNEKVTIKEDENKDLTKQISELQKQQQQQEDHFQIEIQNFKRQNEQLQNELSQELKKYQQQQQLSQNEISKLLQSSQEYQQQIQDCQQQLQDHQQQFKDRLQLINDEIFKQNSELFKQNSELLSKDNMISHQQQIIKSFEQDNYQIYKENQQLVEQLNQLKFINEQLQIQVNEVANTNEMEIQEKQLLLSQLHEQQDQIQLENSKLKQTLSRDEIEINSYYQQINSLKQENENILNINEQLKADNANFIELQQESNKKINKFQTQILHLMDLNHSLNESMQNLNNQYEFILKSNKELQLQAEKYQQQNENSQQKLKQYELQYNELYQINQKADQNYHKVNSNLKNQINQLKSQIQDLEENKLKCEEKALELKQKYREEFQKLSKMNEKLAAKIRSQQIIQEVHENSKNVSRSPSPILSNNLSFFSKSPLSNNLTIDLSPMHTQRNDIQKEQEQFKTVETQNMLFSSYIQQILTPKEQNKMPLQNINFNTADPIKKLKDSRRKENDISKKNRYYDQNQQDENRFYLDENQYKNVDQNKNRYNQKKSDVELSNKNRNLSLHQFDSLKNMFNQQLQTQESKKDTYCDQKFNYQESYHYRRIANKSDILQ